MAADGAREVAAKGKVVDHGYQLTFMSHVAAIPLVKSLAIIQCILIRI